MRRSQGGFVFSEKARKEKPRLAAKGGGQKSKEKKTGEWSAGPVVKGTLEEKKNNDTWK